MIFVNCDLSQIVSVSNFVASEGLMAALDDNNIKVHNCTDAIITVDSMAYKLRISTDGQVTRVTYFPNPDLIR